MSHNQPMTMDNRAGAQDNAGVDLEEVDVYNEYQDIATSPAINVIPEEPRKKTPMTEVAKLVLLTVLILAVIAAGVVMVANTLIRVQNHEQNETKMQERSLDSLMEDVGETKVVIAEQDEIINRPSEDLTVTEELMNEMNETINSLAEILAAKEEQISQQQAEMSELRENLASLIDELGNLKQELDRLKPYTAEECLTEHDNGIYADGTCYFTISGKELITWDRAVEKCASVNASLASPRTEGQWRAVHDLTRPSGVAFWIGFRQSPSDGPWVDMDGNTVTQNVEAKLVRDDTGNDCAYCYISSSWPKFVHDRVCDFEYTGMVCVRPTE